MSHPVYVDGLVQTFGNQSRRKKNSDFKPVNHRLKIDLVSRPAHTEGFVHPYGNQSRRRKPLNPNLLISASKTGLVSHPARAKGLVDIFQHTIALAITYPHQPLTDVSMAKRVLPPQVALATGQELLFSSLWCLYSKRNCKI